MNKAESKYFNTARLMNTALIYLLEKRELDKITVKEICEKAGVNRSTFYLHYESIADLLVETVENLGKDFKNQFLQTSILKSNDKPQMLLTEEYLIPYLNFVKDNRRILKTIHSRPEIFDVEQTYEKMCFQIFYPAINMFNIDDSEKPYILEYYTKGIVAIINKWISNNCEDPIELIIKIIYDCVKIP